MRTEPMTRKEWEEILLPIETQALEDYYGRREKLISPNEVFEIIVEWKGGMASAYEIKSCISRVYGVEL